MEAIDVVNRIIKIGAINVITYFVLIKLINYRDNNFKKTSIVCIMSLLEAAISTFLINYIHIFILIIICYITHSIVIAKITENNVKYSIILTFISLTITYLIYLMSIIFAGLLIKTLNMNISKDNIMILITTVIIETIILYSIFKIKRIKNGITFLQNSEKVDNIGIVGMVFIGIVLIIYSIIQNTVHTRYIFWGMVMEFICLCIWTNKKITIYYKQRIKEKTIEELKEELIEKDEKIDKILKENQNIAIINHKYSNRIKALESFSNKIISTPEIAVIMETEFGREFIEFEKQIKSLSIEYTNEMKEKIKIDDNIDKTGIFGIDTIIEYMNSEAKRNNIKLEVKIKDDIKQLVEIYIKQNRLETLLGDHIKDAIIAINSSNNLQGKIFVEIEKTLGIYEISIKDTGIEFEKNILLKLGKEKVTTHKATGGSGIGFMTTFETLDETKASLIIEEYKTNDINEFTKTIKIRFDGKNKYIIKTYRKEELLTKKIDIIKKRGIIIMSLQECKNLIIQEELTK